MRTIIIICLFMNSINPVFSQSNWFWQNPYPTGNDLSNLQFTDLYTGYALGGDFTILKTTNSGENWSYKKMNVDHIPTGLNGNMKALYFINSVTGYVGRDGIFKTTNGGETWLYHNTDAKINSIVFKNPNTGFAACDNGKIIKTIDGGNNWFNQYSIGDTTIHLYKIDFISPNTGFAVGEFKTIIKTNDEGNTWILKNGNHTGYPLYDFSFINNTTGYATGEYGNLFKTADEGESWTYLSNEFNYRNLTNIHFASPDTGYLVSTYINGTEGNIYKTTNGGNQWSLIFDLEYNINKIAFINNSTAVIATDGGNLYKTSNSGISWHNKIENVSISNLKSICFINEQTGFAAGSNNTVLKTVNGGSEWQKIETHINEDFSYIKFFDNENGYLAGNYLYRTSNSGLNWRKLKKLNGYEYKQVKFMNLDTGYFLRNDTLYKTFNGGNRWKGQRLTIFSQYFSFMKNNDTGYAIDSYTRIYPPPANTDINDLYKTTDNGLSWVLLSTFSNGSQGGFYNSVKFLNYETGFIAGTPGIKKTTNGGMNWTSYAGLNGLSNEIYFYNENVGYISKNNVLYKTSNSGNNWTQVLITSKNLNSYFFTDVNTGYVIGQLGYILKTTTGGVVGTTEEYVNVPSSFYLYQNFPNPFNPVTKIEFDLSKKGAVKLTVYDILGKKIKSIVDSDLSGGRYVYEFDGSNLSSGIYFYTLDTEIFSQTKRMLLIK